MNDAKFKPEYIEADIEYPTIYQLTNDQGETIYAAEHQIARS